MPLLSPQIIAFIAVIEETSFESAARKLAITPSAISQRIKQLEERMGQLLVIRQSPCKPTPAGEQLLKRVKPMSLLATEAIEDLLVDETSVNHNRTFSIAVNEDSLSTWLLTALAQLYQEQGYLFDIKVDDQDYTLDYLKKGAVIGALTSEKTALQGCTVHSLGKMRYCAIASPAFFASYFAQGLTVKAFQHAPMLVYNRKDPLQFRFMKTITRENISPDKIHYLPNSISLLEAAKQHMGWCICAQGLLENALIQQQVINIAPQVSLDEPLYWQHAGVRSQVLNQITQSFYNASENSLY